ncbi:hypothetical protein B0H15DRAFT_817480 [Mycena belliarum]|uniref:Uncharacterized protein n=1 Tax=Mycena belliarum TaxID=1033014 RepID=A0AAD6UFJ1_9AGAR|nr:hypothetical protein B0H15DRAFT_817480 [Mycena belliae]
MTSTNELPPRLVRLAAAHLGEVRGELLRVAPRDAAPVAVLLEREHVCHAIVVQHALWRLRVPHRCWARAHARTPSRGARSRWTGWAARTRAGSKLAAWLTVPRMGSTRNQRPSGRENTSARKTGGVVIGSICDVDALPRTVPLLLLLRSLTAGLAFSLPFALSLLGGTEPPSRR